MALPKIVADLETSLTAKIAVGGTTGTIASNIDDDGVTLADGVYYFTIDGNNSAKEHIRCTKTGTGLSDIYSYSRQGVATSGTVREHRVGAKVIMTDYATYKNYFEAASGLSGPGASTNGNLVSWNGTDGTILADSGVAVSGLVTPTSTNTFTNKRITPRVVTTASDTTAVIDVDITDQYQLTAMAGDTTFSTTGTPTAGQKLTIRFKDDSTVRAITWDAVFRAVGVTLPTTTTDDKTTYVGCVYNATDSKWDALAVVTLV
jgi:hypothetical protein